MSASKKQIQPGYTPAFVTETFLVNLFLTGRYPRPVSMEGLQKGHHQAGAQGHQESKQRPFQLQKHGPLTKCYTIGLLMEPVPEVFNQFINSTVKDRIHRMPPLWEG
jgi:hypothetical protein